MRLGTHTRLYSHAKGEILRPAPVLRSVFSSGVPGLLDRRLIFVTGKGGVGKSTVATALGVLGARHGKRTIVAELASQLSVWRRDSGPRGCQGAGSLPVATSAACSARVTVTGSSASAQRVA